MPNRKSCLPKTLGYTKPDRDSAHKAPTYLRQFEPDRGTEARRSNQLGHPNRESSTRTRRNRALWLARQYLLPDHGFGSRQCLAGTRYIHNRVGQAHTPSTPEPLAGQFGGAIGTNTAASRASK